MSLEATIGAVAPELKIEAIYLAGRKIGHSMLSNLTGENPVVAGEPSKRAAAAAAAVEIIREIEREAALPVTAMPRDVRSKYVVELFRHLRNTIVHDGSVSLHADDELRAMRGS